MSPSAIDITKIPRLQFFYIFLLYAIVNSLLYYKSIGNYFLNDDFHLLYYSDLFVSSIHPFHFRPVRTLIYKLLYTVSGLNPVPYMVFNLILHILTCLAVFLLAVQLFSSFGKYSENRTLLPPFLTGLLFSVLYVHSEAVVYIASTVELIYSLLYLTCVILYLDYRRHRRKSDYVLLCTLFVLMLLSKETAVGLPVTILIIDTYLFRESPKVFLTRNYIIVLILAAYLPFRYFVTPDLGTVYARAPGWLFAVESVKNVIFGYVALFFSLDFMYIKEVYKANYMNLSRLFSAIVNEIPYVIIAILIVGIFYLWAFRKRDRLVNFLILFILITILPWSWLVGYERYLYLTSSGFALLLVYLFFPMSKDLPFKRYLSGAFLFLIFIYNIYALIQKNENWNIAAAESRNIVAQVEEISRTLPPGSEVYFKNLPDNYKGAWIFRDGVQYIPGLILKRDDLKFYPYLDTLKTDPQKKIFCYDYREGKLSIIRQ